MLLNISMVLNLILVLIGIFLLIYAIKIKTRYLAIVGVALLCFGLFSVVVDRKAGGTANADTHRLAFLIGSMM